MQRWEYEICVYGNNKACTAVWWKKYMKFTLPSSHWKSTGIACPAGPKRAEFCSRTRFVRLTKALCSHLPSHELSLCMSVTLFPWQTFHNGSCDFVTDMWVLWMNTLQCLEDRFPVGLQAKLDGFSSEQQSLCGTHHSCLDLIWGLLCEQLS